MRLPVMQHQGVQVPAGVSPLANAVRPSRIGEHGEVLVVRNQFIDQLLDPLVVHVVVGRPMQQQQVPFELAGPGDG